MDKRYIVGAAGLVTLAVAFMVLQASGARITSDGDQICDNICTSYITITGLQNNVEFVNFSQLNPSFSPQIEEWHLYILDGGDWIEHTNYENFTFQAGTEYQLKLVGIKTKKENIKWGLELGELSLDPWWNSTDVSVNVTPSLPTQFSTLNCTGTISNYANSTFNASWIWYLNGSRNTSWDTTNTFTNSSSIWTNLTINASTLQHTDFSCCVNLSNASTSTGYVCSSNVTVRNYNYAMPTNITTINLTCLQPYMNDTEPEGQTHYIPLFNITSRLTTQNITNITLCLNQSINTSFSIYASDTAYHGLNAILLNSSPQVVIKTLSGTSFTESQKGIWLFGLCNNVSDNYTNSFQFILEGGGG